MNKLRYGLVALSLLVCSVTTATAGISIGIGLPNVSIGINLPVYPELARVPGYPVYYAPRMDANYFFYDGMYWVYQNDDWYASSWYNGPWGIVGPDAVPLYILRVPVRYYRQPPMYFRGWQSNAPPRWGQHWGPDWERDRRGWDRWNRRSAPAPAPLPSYQRQYSGERYPRVEQQHTLRRQEYRYQPKDKVVRQHLERQRELAPARQERRPEPGRRDQRQQEAPQMAPLQRGAPPQPPQRGGEQMQRTAPPQTQPAAQQQQPAQQQRQQAPGHQDKGENRGGHGRDGGEQGKDDGHGQGRGGGEQRNDDDRGQGRNR